MIRVLKEGYAAEELSQVAIQLREADFPMVGELMGDLQRTMSGGKVAIAADGLTNGNSPYNRIPPLAYGLCTPVLIAYCLGNGFEKRLAEIYKHVTNDCPQTEQVYFITNQWGPVVWKRYQRKFQGLPANVTVFLFVMGRLVMLT